MKQDVMSCSAKAPMCPCYKALAEKKGAEDSFIKERRKIYGEVCLECGDQIDNPLDIKKGLCYFHQDENKEEILNWDKEHGPYVGGAESFATEGKSFVCDACEETLPLKLRNRSKKVAQEFGMGMGDICRPCVKRIKSYEEDAESFNADERKFVQLVVEYNLPGDPEYITDLLTGANMKIIEMKDYYGAESYSADGEFDRHRSRNKRKKCDRPYCTKPIIVDFNGYCSQICEKRSKPDWMAAETFSADTEYTAIQRFNQFIGEVKDYGPDADNFLIRFDHKRYAPVVDSQGYDTGADPATDWWSVYPNGYDDIEVLNLSTLIEGMPDILTHDLFYYNYDISFNYQDRIIYIKEDGKIVITYQMANGMYHSLRKNAETFEARENKDGSIVLDGREWGNTTALANGNYLFFNKELKWIPNNLKGGSQKFHLVKVHSDAVVRCIDAYENILRNPTFRRRPPHLDGVKHQRFLKNYRQRYSQPKNAETHAYSYAYNDGHSDSRKGDEYRPNLSGSRQEADFKKILKQKAEGFEDQLDHVPALAKIYCSNCKKEDSDYHFACGNCGSLNTEGSSPEQSHMTHGHWISRDNFPELYDAEYSRDSDGRFSSKSAISLTTAAIIGLAGAYFWSGKK
jgi:hypothetical protein